jgi:hypothetical protein
MKKAMIHFDFTIEVICPYCGTKINLAGYDNDACFSGPIFEGRPHDLINESFECISCEQVFKFKGIER